jgi:catechol 2,3-dioxygenase
MSFSIRRAGHVVLRVTDVARTKTFLESIVGFTTYGRIGRDFFFMTSHPVSNHHMIAIRPGKAGERLPDADRQIGMASIAYEMTDLAALHDLHQRIAAAQAIYPWRILALEDRGAIYNLVATDGDNNHYEFWCRAPGKEDAAIQDLMLRGMAALSAGGGQEQASKTSPAAPPSRLEIRRTSHLTLRCRDIATTQQFYEKALGMFLVARDERDRRYFSADANTRRIVLALEPAEDLDAPGPTPKTMYGMEHFSLEVSSFADLQNAYRRFKTVGVPVDHTQDHGVTASVYFHDPDGNLMEVYHDVPRAEIPVPEDPFVSFGGIEDRLERTV